MTRDERIEAAIAACFTGEPAKEAFRKAAAALPTFHVFWNPDEDDTHAILEHDGVSIDFYDLT